MIVKSPAEAWRRLSIRARLSIGYATTLSLLLVVYAVFVYLAVHERFTTEIDHRLDQEVEIVERSLTRGAGGDLVWRPLHEGVVGYQPLANVLWIDVHRLDGTLVNLSLGGYARGATPEPLPYTPRPSGFFTTRLPSGIPLRVLQVEVAVDGERAVIRAAFAKDQIEQELASLLWVLVVGVPLTVGAAALAGYWLASRALSPVAKITEEARSINAEKLSARLAIANPNDELGRLAATFNDLFFRLDQSFGQLKRFTSDASHELRTPLTAIRSVGEVALREHHDDAGYREIIGAMLEEVDRLTLLVESLLTLTRADSSNTTLFQQPVDLKELAAEVANYLKVLAEEKGQQIQVDATHPVTALANRAVLRQAVVNILDNAIKYSTVNSMITLAVGKLGAEAVLEVTDAGPGIAPEHRDQVFDRFYRVDASRSRAEGGFGLGLAIARWAVEANGGRIELVSVLGKGSTFRVILPGR